jgi:hypothetical protein
MAGTGPYADLLRHRFTIATRRFGLQRSPPPLRFEHFTPSRERRTQLALF